MKNISSILCTIMIGRTGRNNIILKYIVIVINVLLFFICFNDVTIPV